MNRYDRFGVVDTKAARSRITISPCCLLIIMSAPFIFVSKVYAYIDPGTGSYVFQLIIAGLLAASFAIKTIWGRVKNFLRSILRSAARKPHRDE